MKNVIRIHGWSSLTLKETKKLRFRGHNTYPNSHLTMATSWTSLGSPKHANHWGETWSPDARPCLL